MESKQPDEIGPWPTFARLVLQKQEEHDRAIAKLKDPDMGFSFSRCAKHDKVIEDFRRLQYGVAALVVVVGFLTPIITLFCKKWFGL